MGLTYTPADDRGGLRARWSLGHLREHLVLAAVSLVSMLAIGLCWLGSDRGQTGVRPRSDPGLTPVNLTQVSDAAALDAALAPAFEQLADRRFAARELLRALASEDPRDLPNVGAIAHLVVPVATIERTRNLVVYADRLRAARERAAAAKSDGPTTIPLFTTADVTAVKSGLIVRSTEEHRHAVFWSAVAFLVGFQLVSLIWLWRDISGDRLLLAAAHLLATLGFVVMLSRPDPLRDSLLVVRYTQSVLVGLGACLAFSLVHVRRAAFLRLSYVSLACAVLLSVVVMVFGSGPGTSGAKVNLGPVQPIEAIRWLILLFLAGYLGRRWELVRQLRETSVRGRAVPEWLNVPRLDHVLPMLGGVAIALVLFFALRDLGPALLLSLIFLTMLAVARARLVVVAAGVALLAAGFYAGYWLNISPTLSARVAMWQSPWQNAVRGGDQIAQAAWAMATGAFEGTGLGLGDTRYLPAGHTDLVLAAIGEELGAIGMLAAIVAFGVIGWRGLQIARAASTDTAVFLSVAMTLSLVAPVLVMSAGILGLMPLTGVVTPFISYGGSAMLANFAALGLLAAARSDRRDEPATAPFRVPLRWLAGALATTAVVVLIVWGRVQVLSADSYLVKPQLSLQADGGLRYQYNPRVLDAARTLPRGAIYDRRDVPLAADPATARGAERGSARLHVSLRDACPNPQERCYPFGGDMFHLLGDARTRANWSASNTSYVERDEEDRLRGFDDRAVTVRTSGVGGRSRNERAGASESAERSGAHGVPASDAVGGPRGEAPGLVIRRDYRDLVPLVRHRWEPDHPDVRALMNRSRDLHLTIDARLQSQAAGLLARWAALNGIRHAAIVVLDADTGDLLTSVSYPWPDIELAGGIDATDAMLDRARFGVYPPGSTFKLITAAAALQQDPALSQLSFTCSRLPDGRVGSKIPGFGRPVRDDVLDEHPHGTLTMHDGLVKSCNAYFAQLAVRLGTPALANMASLAGISFPTSGSPDAVLASLPYLGYGQGRVLATPLRMARVAAAIATDGLIRESPIVRTDAPAEPKRFLSADTSRRLAGYMRDVVTDGTGRILKNHPVRIAGKTGTAEVDHEKSHAWFVGFAPAGPAAHRIAFAVIVENAGYGGASAASVAGEVVTSAASLGLIK